MSARTALFVAGWFLTYECLSQTCRRKRKFKDSRGLRLAIVPHSFAYVSLSAGGSTPKGTKESPFFQVSLSDVAMNATSATRGNNNGITECVQRKKKSTRKRDYFNPSVKKRYLGLSPTLPCMKCLLPRSSIYSVSLKTGTFIQDSCSFSAVVFCGRQCFDPPEYRLTRSGTSPCSTLLNSVLLSIYLKHFSAMLLSVESCLPAQLASIRGRKRKKKRSYRDLVKIQGEGKKFGRATKRPEPNSSRNFKVRPSFYGDT